MYTVSHHIAEIDNKDYIAHYRDAEKFIVYCQKCMRYNACWACPPFDFDVEAYISSYKTAYIVGTKIVVDADVRTRYTGWEQCTKVSYQMIEEVRKDLDKNLLELETAYLGSRAFFTGTCHICPAEKCARIIGKPCIAPDKIRPPLEAFGFDISKTSSQLLNIEMKWSREGILPEYFTLVSGLFSNKEIDEQIIIKQLHKPTAKCQ